MQDIELGHMTVSLPFLSEEGSQAVARALVYKLRQCMCPALSQQQAAQNGYVAGNRQLEPQCNTAEPVGVQ